MYIPPSFHQTDLETLNQFMDQHSFATLISHTRDEPFASHLPLLLDRGCGTWGRLVGHMARANPQWRMAADQLVLAIFQGPHVYISPTWYEAQNVVPTWNYVTVHASGTLRLIEDEARLRAIVERTVETYEASQPVPWSMSSPDADFIRRLLAGVVGFEIEIDRLEGKWKLSQNHPLEFRQRVITRLRESPGQEAHQIAEFMTTPADERIE